MKFQIRISDHPSAYSEYHSTAEIDGKENAIAYLWALAKQDIPQYGQCWLPLGIEPMTNLAMFYADPPVSMKQKIESYIKQLNEPDIESLVVQGLNVVFEALSKHANDPEFVSKITESAKEWAKDCYQ